MTLQGQAAKATRYLRRAEKKVQDEGTRVIRETMRKFMAEMIKNGHPPSLIKNAPHLHPLHSSRALTHSSSHRSSGSLSRRFLNPKP
jgi:hypothetical protein